MLAQALADLKTSQHLVSLSLIIFFTRCKLKSRQRKKKTLFKTKNKGNEGMKNCYSELVIFNTVDLEIKGLKLLFLSSNSQWTFFHASFTSLPV
jgi:hypothetical protein